jgi:hypothetical protein
MDLVMDQENRYIYVLTTGMTDLGFTLAKETSCVGIVLHTGGLMIITIMDTGSEYCLPMCSDMYIAVLPTTVILISGIALTADIMWSADLHTDIPLRQT